MAVLIVASSLLIGAKWGPIPGLALLVLAVVMALVGIMTMVGGIARTAEQAGNLQAIVGVPLAMMGGAFIQISGGGLLSKLSLLTPHAWFLLRLSGLNSAVASPPRSVSQDSKHRSAKPCSTISVSKVKWRPSLTAASRP